MHVAANLALEQDTETGHVTYLGHEVGIGGQLEGLHSMRLQVRGAPDPLDRGYDKPQARAMQRELQYVTSVGMLSSMRTLRASIRVSSIVRGASGHHSRYRRHHFPTVPGRIFECSTMSLLWRPSARPSVIRARRVRLIRCCEWAASNLNS